METGDKILKSLIIRLHKSRQHKCILSLHKKAMTYTFAVYRMNSKQDGAYERCLGSGFVRIDERYICMLTWRRQDDGKQ